VQVAGAATHELESMLLEQSRVAVGAPVGLVMVGAHVAGGGVGASTARCRTSMSSLPVDDTPPASRSDGAATSDRSSNTSTPPRAS